MLTTESVKEFAANLKEMQDMIQVLGQDCKEHYTATRNGDNQSQRRAYVRSVFAFIEGVGYRMKETARHFGANAGTLSIEELVALSELSFKINEKGEVVSETIYPKFLNNFRFVFRTLSKSFGSTFTLDCGRSGWENLKVSIKVRDRLMHPKNVNDLEVTDAELEESKKAFDWFFLTHSLSSLYNQKAVHTKSNPTPEEIKALDQKISDLEKNIASRGF